jgi:Gas vesicle synthesis protein GvpO
MADKTTESRKQRRERRRSLAAEPFEQLDEAARDSDPGQSEAARTVKHALATAVAGAVAAGIGGATKAWLDRRDSNGSDQLEQRERAEEPSSDGDEPDVEAAGTETAEAAGTETAEAAETEADEAAETETADEPEPVAEAGEAEEGDEREQDAAEDGSPDQAQATPRGETGTIVDSARDELEQLLGREVESVSGFERAHDGWRVTLEVVEVRRVPESTDVLGSYEVVLDDDRSLVSFNQTHRYRRSQVEEA